MPPLNSSSRHRSLHRCAASSAFVVAPPRPSLSCRCSLPCCAAGFSFVIAPPPVLHLSLRRHCLPCRAAATFVIALPLASSSRHRSIFFFKPPPTSIAPKSIQSHSPYVPIRYRILLSSLLSTAKALLSRHHCLPHPAADFILKSPLSTLSHHLSLHHHTVGSAFLLALTPLSSSRCFLHCAAAPFIVVPSLPSSLCRQFCLCHRAAAAFFVKPPFPSLSRCQFCLRHRANASSAFVVAPPLTSLSHCCCFCHRAAARFIVAPPLYFFFLNLLPPRLPPNRSNRTPLTSPSGIAFSSLRCCQQPKPSYRATAAFLTPPLTSSSSRHSLNCRTTFPFIVAPPVLPSSMR